MAEKKNYFWAFFVIALVIGSLFGLIISSNLTGYTTSSTALVDSDNGKNYELAGVCIDSKGNQFADKCLSTKSLGEWYIHPTLKRCVLINYNCKLGGFAGCINGECVTQNEWDQMMTPIKSIE